MPQFSSEAVKPSACIMACAGLRGLAPAGALRSCWAPTRLAGAGGQAGADRPVDTARSAVWVTVKPNTAGDICKRRLGKHRGYEPGSGELAQGECGPVEGVVSLSLARSKDAAGFAFENSAGVAGGVRVGERRPRARLATVGRGGRVREEADEPCGQGLRDRGVDDGVAGAAEDAARTDDVASGRA